LIEDSLNANDLAMVEEEVTVRKYLGNLLKFLAMEHLLVELSNYVFSVEGKISGTYVIFILLTQSP
jgi:hypothetical protein